MDLQTKTFEGGINKDALVENQKNGEYWDANDIQTFINASGAKAAIGPDDGNIANFTVPAVLAQSQLYVLIIDYTTASIDVTGTKESDGTVAFLGTLQSGNPDDNTWATAIRADINTMIAGFGTCTGFTRQGAATPFTWLFEITFNVTSIVWNYTNTSSNQAYITQEGYFAALGEPGTLIPFYGKQHFGQLLVFSSKDNTGGSGYNNAVGEIGVVISGTYTRLARSKKWKFSTTYTFDATPEGITTGRTGVYLTDDVNFPRVFYYNYSTSYTDDWCIIRDSPNFILTPNPNGQYYYNNIDQSVRLQLQPNNAQISLLDVSSGGLLTAGGKRYAVRFYVSTLAATRFSSLSKLVQIPFVSEPASTSQGGEGQSTTYKSELRISECDPTLYDYIELACVEYNDGAVSGFIVGRYPLSSTSIDITHTGSESLSTTLDLAELSDLSTVVATAKNLAIKDNRLFLANITLKEEPDLTAWAQASVTLAEYQDNIPSLSADLVTGANFTNFSPTTTEEFYVADRTFRFMTYMPIETYRFGIRIHWTDGSVSQPYFVGDLTFSDQNAFATNTGSPNAVIIKILQATVDFSAFPVAFTLVKGYEIVRAECIREVLAAGWGLASFGNPEVGYFAAGYPLAVLGAQPANASTLMAFISPDLYLGHAQITPAAGDLIYNYGVPQAWNTASINPAGSDFVNVAQFDGFADSTPQILNVEVGEAVQFNSRGTTVLGGGLKYTTSVYTTAGTFGGTSVYSLGLKTDVAIAEKTGATNYLNYLCFYVRLITDKYGDYKNTQYISCGHYESIVNYSTTSYTGLVYGGDTFVQKHWLRTVNASVNAAPQSLFMGMSYYTWSRANGQMRRLTDPSQTTFPLNTTNLSTWLYANLTTSEDLAYDSGYSGEGGQAQLFVGFNPDLIQNNDLPTRAMYSQSKPSNSQLDLYRYFLPLDFKDYSTDDGEINSLLVRNNDLLVMQPTAILSQGVNTTAVVSTADGLPTSLGNGAVLTTQAMVVTNFGLSQKGAAHRYLSTRGGVTIAWFDSLSKKFLRLGADGIKVISDTNNMRSWFFVNTVNVTTDLTMTMAYDIHKEELLITAKGAPLYTSWWTLVWNEYFDAFTSFRSAKPQVYMELKNNVLSADYKKSAGDTTFVPNNVYIHVNSTNTPSYYGLVTTPYVMTVVNKAPLDVKRYMTTWFNIVTPLPTLVQFFVYPGNSSVFSSTADSSSSTFVQRRDYYLCLIPNNSADGRLRSKYLGIKITFALTNGLTTRLTYLATKFLNKFRPFNI